MNRLHDQFFGAKGRVPDAYPAGRLREDGPARRRAGAAVRLRGRRRRRPDVARRRRPRSTIRGGRERSTWRSTSPRPDAVVAQRHGAGHAGHQHRARHDRLAARTRPSCGSDRRRRGRRHRRRAEFLDRRGAVRGAGRASGRAVRRPARVRRLDPRGASRDEEGRAVRHRAEAEAVDGSGGLHSRRSTSPPPAPATFRAPTRLVSTDRRNRLR